MIEVYGGFKMKRTGEVTALLKFNEMCRSQICGYL